MLSSLPKIADRTFILGAFLPTLLFALSLLTLFRDQEFAQTSIKALMAKDLGESVFLLFAVWIIAVLMLTLNYWLYQFLEGDLLPSWIADRLKKRNRQQLQCSLRKLDSLTNTDRDAFWYGLLQQTPLKDDQVLPTRFGNAIRAFEIYPSDIYGADAITIGLRLTSVIPKEFSQQIQNVKSQVDLFVNCSFFSIMIALLGLIRTIVGMVSPYSINTYYEVVEVLLWTVSGLLAAYVFYRLAVISVPAWGDLVKSAFDCYLPALAKQLGFELPQIQSERLSFWTTFSQQLLYRRDGCGELLFHVDKWRKAVDKDEPEANLKSADLHANDDENTSDSA